MDTKDLWQMADGKFEDPLCSPFHCVSARQVGAASEDERIHQFERPHVGCYGGGMANGNI